MTHSQSIVLAAFGVVILIAGLTWLLGPWGLIGSGLVVTAAALLAPERERRGEPTEPDPQTGA